MQKSPFVALSLGIFAGGVYAQRSADLLSVFPKDRVPAIVDYNRTTPLRSHVHPAARAEFELLAGTITLLGTMRQGYAANVTANPHGTALGYVTLYPTGAQVPVASMLNDFQKQVVTNSAIAMRLSAIPGILNESMTAALPKSALALTFFTALAFGQLQPATTYTISGAVGDTTGLCKTAVTMTLTGGGVTMTQGDTFTGTFSFAGLAAGTYTLTPTKPGCTYTPPSLTVTLTNANDTTANFNGAVAQITLSPATLPSGVLNTPYSVQLTASNGVAPYTFTLSSGNMPGGLTLSPSGLISGAPAQLSSLPFTVQVEDSRFVVATMVYTIVITAAPTTLTVSPATLPSATVNAAYSAQLTATGGAAPYTFSVVSGSLPSGLTLSSSGSISGTPTQQSAASFTIQAKDSNGVTAQATYTISVAPSTTLTIGPATLPSATVNTAYSAQLTATGGTAPYSFTLLSGSLPTGLSMPSTGLISGTPSQQSTASFTVQAKDANGVTAQMAYTLTIAATPTLTLGPASLPSATVGVAYSQQLNAGGGTAPYTFTLISGALPTGLSMPSTGLISGTPSQQSTASFTVQAKDANGVTAQMAYTLTVAATPTLTLGPASLPSATVGVAYSQQLTASGGTAPYSFALASGALPTGLTLSTSGLIGGTPTQQTAASFTVQAKDATSLTGQLAYNLTVAPAATTITLSPVTLPPAIVGAAYSAQLTAGGGAAPYTFSVLSGALPSGLTLSTGGLIGGTPTQQATASFTVQAKDANASTGQMAYTLTVGANNCTYNLAPPSGNLQISGGTTGFTVSTQAGCPSGVLIDDNAWLHLTSSTTLSGGGSVSLSVDANAGPAGRSSVVGVTDANGAVVATYAITQSGTAASLTGLTFVSLPPCRVLETRTGQNGAGQAGVFGPPSFTAGQTRTLPLPQSSACNIPATAKAYVVNVTSLPAAPGRANNVTIYPADEEQPRYTTIGTPDGNVRANGAIIRARSTDGAINVYSTDASDVLIDVAGYFTDSAVSKLVFYPLTPCRVVETRAAARGPGPFGGPSMSAGETRVYPFPASPDCSIPKGAAAYSMTITVAPPGPLFYLTAWPGPAGVAQPVVSSLNAFDGAIVPNSAIIPAGSDGSIQIYTSNATDFFIDINGYFAPDDGKTGLSYFPVTQCTAANSADPLYSGVYGGPSYPGGARSIAIPTSPFCATIPTNAQGYAVDVTANPHGNVLAYVTLYPTGSPVPTASMLNDFQKQTVTNSAIVPAGPNGSIDVFTNGAPTDIQLMISGYFSR